MSSPCDEYPKGAKKCAKQQPSFVWLAIRRFVGSLVTSFMIASLAIPSAQYALVFGAPALSAWEYGGIMAALILAAGLVFNQFEAWHHFLPHLTIADLLHDVAGPTNVCIWLLALLGMVGSLGGYFIGYAIANAITPFAIDASTLTSVSFGADFYFEFIGMLLTCHVFVFSSREFWGVWGIVGIALLQGALIAGFMPVTGGSFNFWHTLSVGAIEGTLSSSGWGAKLLATIVAPVLTVIIKLLVFPSPMRN